MSVERRNLAVCSGSNNTGGKGEMTKAPIGLQDLRRSLYAKAKAEPLWRFWGLYVHVCKMETLREAYQMARSNNGGRASTALRSRPSRKVEWKLSSTRFGRNWSTTRIGPCRHGRRRYRRTGGRKSAFSRFPASGIAWSREHSSSIWSRSSKRISNRGRMDIDRNGRRMKP